MRARARAEVVRVDAGTVGAVRGLRLGAAVASGVALVVAFPPYGRWWVAWVALVPLWIGVSGVAPRQAFLLGWLTGTIAQAGLLGWVGPTLGAFSALPLPVVWLIFALLAVAAGLPMGVFAAGLCATERRGWGGVIVGAAWLVVAEWLGTWVPVPKVWGVFGTTQAGVVVIAQAAELVGIFGLSAVLVVVNGVVAEAIRSPPELRRGAYRRMAVVAGIVGAVAAYGAVRLRVVDAWPVTSSLRVGIFHTLVDQRRKWNSDYRTYLLAQYRELMSRIAADRPAVVLWPETAVPFYFEDDPSGRNDVERLVRQVGVPLLFGSPAVERDAEQTVHYHNRAYLLDADARIVGTYDKRILVPFGEYVPFAGLLRFVRPLIATPQAMEVGTTSGVVAVGPARLGIQLCYESAFPWLARRAVDDGATVLVNLSNDAWFGVAGASQALAFARLRAIETRRALVRVASGGASAVVAPSGRVVWAAPAGRASAEVVEVPLREGRTVYVTTGDAVVWVAWIVVTLASLANGLYQNGKGLVHGDVI